MYTKKHVITLTEYKYLVIVCADNLVQNFRAFYHFFQANIDLRKYTSISSLIKYYYILKHFMVYFIVKNWSIHKLQVFI